MNVTQLPEENVLEAGAIEWQERTARKSYHAPEISQRPVPRPRCCARCVRGTRAMNMPCAYGHQCPNPGCDHAARSAD